MFIRELKRYRAIEWSPIILSVLFIALIVLSALNAGIAIHLDIAFLVALVAMIIAGRMLQFALDWIPFLLILFVYEILTRIIPAIVTHINIANVANFELSAFGTIPTIWLQRHFFNGALHWYDYLLTFIYALHFIIPQFFAAILWRKSIAKFRFFVFTLLVLSYMGFLTYLLFPAAPPWYAASKGVIGGVVRIQELIYAQFHDLGLFTVTSKSSLFSLFKINDFAAMPSLHVAYPTLLLIMAYHFFKRKFVYILPYALLIYIGVVYLGEHYVTDAIFGVIYAIIAYLSVRWIVIFLQKHNWLSARSIDVSI